MLPVPTQYTDARLRLRAGIGHRLSEYLHGGPTWFSNMDPKLGEIFDKVTKGRRRSSTSVVIGESQSTSWF